MKSVFLACSAALAVVLTAGGATPVVAFLPNYAKTNYAASTNSGSISDQASGLWLGNLRGKQTWRDLIIANKASDTISIRMCRDDGTFGSISTYSVGPAPMGVRSANFNGDIYEDVVVANSGTNTVTILMNYGGRLLDRIDYTVGTISEPGPVALGVGDVNNDGATDILVANSLDNTVSVLLKSSGLFSLSTNIPVGANPRSVQVADVNGDSRNEVITANRTDGTVTIGYQDTNGVFATITNFTLFEGGDPQPVQASVHDFDADGYLDIVCANYNSNSITILRGTSNHWFTAFTNYTVGVHPTSMVLRDFNRDGQMDVAVASETSGRVDVFVANGGCTFVAGYTAYVESSPQMITGSNFNNDDNNDIAVANNGDNTISILLYDLPVAYSATFAAKEDSTNTIALKGTVAAGITDRALSYSIVSWPSYGTLSSGTNATRTYITTNDYFGPDSFTFQVSDGVWTSEVATVTLNVLPINDAPSFSLVTNHIELTLFNTLNYRSNFVSSLSLGPTNEASQRYSFLFLSSVPGFFTTSPTIDTNGTLKFKLATNAVGTNVVTVYLRDAGGTTYGGINTSAVTTVNFVGVTNPYPSQIGAYNGLFYDTNIVAHDSSGFMTLTLNAYGAFSGKILLGRSYAMSGRFNASGSAELTIKRGTNLPPLSASLEIVAAGTTDQISGTVSDGVWTANVLLDRYTWNPTNNPAPQAGRFTMLIAGGTNATENPPGQGYATVIVDAGGKVKASGVLADGKAFAQATVLSKDSVWPLYSAAYTTNGCVLSWITFTNQTSNSFTGLLSWIKTENAAGTHYTDGFSEERMAQGSTYVTNSGLALALTNGLAILTDGNMLPSTNSVYLGTNNIIYNLGGALTNLSLRASLSSGIISGSFKHPVLDGARMSVRGIVFQQQTNAGGFFLGATQGGLFELQRN